MRIIFDYNRTLFDPETDSLYRGVPALLRNLSGNNELFLISRNEQGRKDRLKELGIENYFKDIVFVKEKTLRVFRTLARNGTDVLVIGDRVREEIFLGNQLGFITIWIRQGKFSAELPTKPQEQPSYTVSGVMELRKIILKYEK